MLYGENHPCTWSIHTNTTTIPKAYQPSPQISFRQISFQYIYSNTYPNSCMYASQPSLQSSCALVSPTKLAQQILLWHSCTQHVRMPKMTIWDANSESGTTCADNMHHVWTSINNNLNLHLAHCITYMYKSNFQYAEESIACNFLDWAIHKVLQSTWAQSQWIKEGTYTSSVCQKNLLCSYVSCWC